MWAPVPILLGVIILLVLSLIWTTHKFRQEVRTLHWRLDSIWKKSQVWHNKVDRVTGQVRRMTGEHWAVEHEGAEEYDDVDRSADTQPRDKPVPVPRKKKTSKRK